jgi:hypothetical protein
LNKEKKEKKMSIKKGKKTFLGCIALLAFMVASCADSDSPRICYTDRDGSTVLTEGTMSDMLEALAEKDWPHAWSEDTLELIIEDISGPGDLFITFEACPEGILITDVSSETGMVVRHAAVANMWRNLGKYEVPLDELVESSHNQANEKPGQPDPRSGPAYRHQRELQMWNVWANGIRQQAKHIPPGEGMQVGGFDGEPVTLTRNNVEEVITASKPEPGSLRKWSDPSYNHQDN